MSSIIVAVVRCRSAFAGHLNQLVFHMVSGEKQEEAEKDNHDEMTGDREDCGDGPLNQ